MVTNGTSPPHLSGSDNEAKKVSYLKMGMVGNSPQAPSLNSAYTGRFMTTPIVVSVIDYTMLLS